MVTVRKQNMRPLYEAGCETCGVGLADMSSDGRVYLTAHAHARKGHYVYVRCITELVFDGTPE